MAANLLFQPAKLRKKGGEEEGTDTNIVLMFNIKMWPQQLIAVKNKNDSVEIYVQFFALEQYLSNTLSVCL